MGLRILDLFCGAGGAAMGYYRAGFKDITGIDNCPMPRYPFKFIQTDALEYLAEHGHEYDMIHASPPCQRYSVITRKSYKNNHPDLIGLIRDALQKLGKPYIIENVTGARFELENPIKLCGSMFGLGVWRHRWFEINPPLLILAPTCNHSNVPVLVTGTPRRNGYKRADPSIALRRKAMDIDWMITSELDEAIPPAYTEYIGKQLLRVLNGH